MSRLSNNNKKMFYLKANVEKRLHIRCVFFDS